MNQQPINLESSLYRYFGFSKFRPLQKEIVTAILEGKDTLAILPTGAGKSLCFQLPAVLLPGTTLIISPLISLMKDQVEHCLAKQIPAGYLSSTQSKQTQHETLELFRLRKLKLLYVSPERIRSIRFQVACQRVDIKLLVIDEAHCLSTWGHDFRPEYRQILDFIKSRPNRPTIAAFTASATPQTQTDIITTLNLNQPQRFFSTFRRPNLHFHVITTPDHFHKTLYTLRLITQAVKQHLIIYAATRANTEFIAQLIQTLLPHISIAAYHAGLEKTERERVQTLFQYGKIQIIVATSAFGMGVDKADVRAVIHFQLPASLEDYYQEAGRAGRDGLAAECYLFANQDDVDIQNEMIGDTSNKEQLRRSEQKLKALIKYVNQSRRCRQVEFSRYFGELSTEPCGVCDVCQTKTRACHPEPTYLSKRDVTLNSFQGPRGKNSSDISSSRKDIHKTKKRVCHPELVSGSSNSVNTQTSISYHKANHPLLLFASTDEINRISRLLHHKRLLSKQKPQPIIPLLTNRLICQIALLQPTSSSDWMRLAGIGSGNLESLIQYTPYDKPNSSSN